MAEPQVGRGPRNLRFRQLRRHRRRQAAFSRTNVPRSRSESFRIVRRTAPEHRQTDIRARLRTDRTPHQTAPLPQHWPAIVCKVRPGPVSGHRQ